MDPKPPTLSIFDEFYFWTYYYLRKLNVKGDRDKAHTAYVSISMTQAVDVVVVWAIVRYFLGVDLGSGTDEVLAIALAITLFVVNHFVLYRKREEIFQRYEDYHPARKQHGKIVFWTWFILSYFLTFFLASYIATPKH